MNRERLRRIFEVVARFRAALFREPLVSVAFLAPALIALAYASCVFAVRLWYECRLPYNADTSVYWTVGNGIVHGLVPYRDLFETKPPGIFLLSALSYRILGNGHLTNATQILSVLAIPLSPLVYARRLWRGSGRRFAVVPIFVALWALVVDQACFVADNAAEVQTEAHAVPALILYMLLLGAPGRIAFALRTLGILVAVGMKEPFVLAVPAVYLLLDPQARNPWSDFFGPLAAAGVIGATFLLLAGWLPAYLGIYLETMANGHVNVVGSPWGRVGVSLDNTWNMLATHSPLVPFTLLFLAGVYLFLPGSSARSPGVVIRVQALCLAMLLGSMAVGMGGQFYPHHYMFATPVHLALLFSLMGSLAQSPNVEHWSRSGIAALALLCVFIPKWVKWEWYEQRLVTLAAEDENSKAAAAVIDSTLDRFKVDRYLWLGHPGRTPLPFTRHSPLGPLFFQEPVFFDGHYAWLASEFEKRLHEAKIAVFANPMTGPNDAHVKAVLNAEYEPLPSSYVPKEANFVYKLYIRKGLLQR